MNRTLIKAAAFAGVLAVGGGTAMAAHDTNPSAKVASYSYDLNAVQADAVPNSQASGQTRVKALPNGKLQVTVTATGLAPNLPHAMHLHGIDGGGDNGCPGPDNGADANGDGVITVLEGAPFYGGILASLTTTGDTSPASALALDRFPVADADGNLEYQRTFRNEAAYAEAGTVQVVVHGIDFDGNGAYAFGDGFFSAMGSSLNPSIPLEATVPALCGGIAN